MGYSNISKGCLRWLLGFSALVRGLALGDFHWSIDLWMYSLSWLWSPAYLTKADRYKYSIAGLSKRAILHLMVTNPHLFPGGTQWFGWSAAYLVCQGYECQKSEALGPQMLRTPWKCVPYTWLCPEFYRLYMWDQRFSLIAHAHGMPDGYGR